MTTKHLYVLAAVHFLVAVFALAPSSAAATGSGASESSAQANTIAERRSAQIDDPTRASLVEPVRTDSPRQTMKTFLRLVDELEVAVLAYRRFRNRLNFERITILEPQFVELLDLTHVPKAARWETGVETSVFLLDILGRVELPRLDEVPDAAALDNVKQAKWRIPGTPIRIVRVADGPREGEFLFSPRTTDIAPIFHSRIAHLPLRSDIGIASWHKVLLQGAGPLIPVELIQLVPEPLMGKWLDTPIWKVAIISLFACVTAVLLFLLHRILRLYKPEDRVWRYLRRLVTPIAAIIATLAVKAFVGYEIVITGAFATLFNGAAVVVVHICAIVALWLFMAMLSEWIIRSPKIKDDSLDADLLRLTSRVMSFLGGLIIFANAGQILGLPVFSILAGLGIGGLAVALAVRPSLENLISGIMLYLDRPVRVGDYCRFGDRTGTIEHIGMRTTRVRTLDRTVIAVPNSVFADQEIENWANCDKMQIRTVVGLRYETTPDQMRHVLAKLREMLLAHPGIDSNTVRVRFIGYGASSLDVEIRVYALTREWNEFYAIREDVLLRASEIVSASGSGFAFPSQTVYMRRDDGLDTGLAAQAVEEVRSWRHSGDLPFPHVSDARAQQLKGTLDYPPHGSAGATHEHVRAPADAAPFNSAVPGQNEMAAKTVSLHRLATSGNAGSHQYVWLNPSRHPRAPKDSA